MKILQDMRVWYMGCALAFQAIEPGSSPGTRSKISHNVEGCSMTSYYDSVYEMYPERKICALCDSGFKSTPTPGRRALKVLEVDGKPVESPTYITFSPAAYDKILEAVKQ